MARDGNTIRRAARGVDGRTPYGCELVPRKTRQRRIKDHVGNDVVMAWVPQRYAHSPDDLPPVGFPIYVTADMPGVPGLETFAHAFVQAMQSVGGIPDQECKSRYDFFTRPRENMLGCLSHARTEVRHRNSNGLWPRLVRSWTAALDWYEYQGFMIVVDSPDWEKCGVSIVFFDAIVHDSTDPQVTWNLRRKADVDCVKAWKCSDLSKLPAILHGRWLTAGHTWLQAELQRYNDGAGSPALYPAVDPAARADVDIDEAGVDSFDLVATGLANGPTSEHGPFNPTFHGAHTGDPGSNDDVWSQTGRPAFIQEYFTDSTNTQVESIWHKAFGVNRPPFSYTLYVAGGLPDLTASAIFTCLNRSLLKQTPWVLDIVRSKSCLHHAYSHHQRDTQSRTLSRLDAKRRTIEHVLCRVAGDKLPVELLEQIESLLIPPPIPEYSAIQSHGRIGLAGHEHCSLFLFLDSDALKSGPLIVTAATDASSSSAATKSANPDFASPLCDENIILSVGRLEDWLEASCVLHTFWSLTGPRCTIHQPTPYLHIHLESPYVWIANGSSAAPLPTITTTLHGCDSAVTLHKMPLLSVPSLDQLIEVRDLTTNGAPVAIVWPPGIQSSTSFLDLHQKWDILDEPSNSPVLFGTSGEPRTMCTLRPDEPRRDVLPVIRYEYPYQSMQYRKQLVKGHEYSIRICARTEIFVPRWTWGAWDQRQGPYNLPPMPVVIDGDLRFRHEFANTRDG